MLIINEIYLLILLIILSAFFSMSETALIALSRIKLRSMLNKNVKGAKTVKKLKDDQHRILSTILIGNNLVNVAAAAIATSIAFRIIPDHAVAAATAGITIIILIFGEITPKSLATYYSGKIAIIVAKPILWLSYILDPILRVTEAMTGKLFKPVKTPKITEEELKTCVQMGAEEGILEDIGQLMDNIFKFDDINVSEIMTPRRDIIAVPFDKNLKQVLPTIIKSGKTRIPVFEGNLNKVLGILNIKDLLPILKKNKLNIPVTKVMYPPFFVPESKKVDSMLNMFRKRKEHMAIVVDEHGLVVGLITLENVIEEIVGEIKDETDKLNPHIKKIEKKTWDVLGKADIEEVNEKIKSRFQIAPDYDTISGLILDTLGRIPKEEETLTIGKYIIEITEVQSNRIVKVKIKKK